MASGVATCQLHPEGDAESGSTNNNLWSCTAREKGRTSRIRAPKYVAHQVLNAVVYSGHIQEPTRIPRCQGSSASSL